MKLAICGRNEISAEKSEFYRQVSAQLGRLDYRKLYSAYSGTIRKSQVEPRILFEIIVCAYMKGIYSSRKIEELCRENIQFILILDGHKPPELVENIRHSMEYLEKDSAGIIARAGY